MTRLLNLPTAIGLLFCIAVGCDSEHAGAPNTANGSYKEQMRLAVSNSDWEAAWDYSDKVLIESSHDPETIELVAQVAFQTGRKSIAADLLVESARLDGLRDTARFQRAFTGLLSAGRLFDGLDLLREGVALKPTDSDLRRLLFDLLVATEQHLEASTHRQILIRKRLFDQELLFSAYRYDVRIEEIDSLAKVLENNPSDARPLIGSAKRFFDQQRFDDAIVSLQSIVTGHPEFLAAQAMLGRAIVASGQFSLLSRWAAGLPENIDQDPDFWLTLGDWSLQNGEHELALSAYGHAAQQGIDRVEPWHKLAPLAALQSNGDFEVDMIKQRAKSLTQLRQGYAEFNVRDEQSAASVEQITRALIDLGRIWEAEAWVALGTTLPALSETERQSLEELRAEVLKQLRSDTPWQLATSLPSWSWLKPQAPAALIATLSRNQVPHSRDSIAGEAHLRTRATAPGRPIRPMLDEQASQHGLVFFGRTADDLAEPAILNHQMIGCGGGVIDFDLDGWPDLYLIDAGGTPPHQDSRPNAMFRNLGGRFQNVSLQCGAEDRGFGQGVAVGDLNEDGFDDLLVLNYGPSHVWINHGDGTFSDQSLRWMPASSTWSTSAAIADVDGDGISDVFIANYCAGLDPTTDVCFAKGHQGTKVPRTCSPNHFLAERDIVLKGAPEGRFVDVTESWNAIPDVLGRGLGIVAGSFDDRAGMDLLVANDMTTNHFWSRSRSLSPTGSFALEESAALRGLATDGQSRSQGSMGIAVADLNQDDLADFYVTNFEFEYNTLHLSQGATGWNDQTAQEKLAEETLPMVGFGTQAVDLDNNGECELMVANGHVDHIENPSGVVFYEQPAQLFQRNSSGVFESVGDAMGSSYFNARHVGRGLWTIDANRDGKVDLVATHQTEPTALLINQTASRFAYVTLRLIGKQDARDAVGSVVTVRSHKNNDNDRSAVHSTWFLTSGDGFLGSNERCIRVGLGESDADVDVTVRWLNGENQTWSSLKVNREWLLVQDEPAFSL